MAKIRDYAITIYAATTASMVCEMPTHATGDLLVAFVNKDSASAFTTPGGWTATQTVLSAGAAGGIYTKRAVSAAETVTFALTLETCCAVIVAVRNVFGTTVADAVSASAVSGSDDSTLPYVGVGLTPAHANCLVLHGLSCDLGLAAAAEPPWINLFAGDTGANSLCVSYTQQKTAAAITAPNHWAGLITGLARGLAVAIRDDGTNTVYDAYLPLSTTPSRLISPLVGSTGVVDKGAYIAANSTTLTTLAGKTVTGVTAGTAVADSGVNPFRGSLNAPGASSTTNLAHTEFVLTATDNLTQLQGLVFATWQNVAPRDYVDTGTAVRGGKYIVIGNDASNYRAWVVGGQFTKTEKADARNNMLIEVATSDTIYGTLGSPNYATADWFAFGQSGYYGAAAVRWSELRLLDVFQIAGGAATNPITFNELIFAVNNGGGIVPLMQQAGSGATVWCPLKFGNATTTADPVFISCNLNTFQMPTKADEIDFVDFHVSNDKIGYEFDGQDRGGGAVDILRFTNCVFTSESSYYWRFAATHDAGATVDFAGSTVVKANVTLRSTVSLTSVSFINCTAFTQNNAALTSCKFQGTTVTSDNPSDIASCSFISAGTGHGLVITAPGTYTLSADAFSGYAATNGSTGNEAVYNNSGGAVTLNVTGAAAPTIRNGAGASTTVVASSSLTLTGLKNPTEVRVLQAGTTTVIAGQEDVISGTFTTSIDSATYPNVDIAIVSLGYQNTRLLTVSMASNVSIPVQQVVDRQYVNP
jgi:hypothetical protein